MGFFFIRFFIVILAERDNSPTKLNEWGDFLAGYFAPVLFIWLVYGVFLQKEEFGNIVDSFSLQKEEFTKSVSAMESQVTQVEVQQLNTWFNRNIQTINTIKRTLFLNIKNNTSETSDTIDSIFLINQKLKENYEIQSDFFPIFDELKSILDIFIYMEEHLKKIRETRGDNLALVSAIENLTQELEVLYKDDYQNIKEIMTLVYIFIVTAIKGNIDYKVYKNYSNWVSEKEEDIYNIFLDNTQSSFELTIKKIIENLETISRDIDFKIGV